MLSMDCSGTACAWNCATTACTARAKFTHTPGHATLCLDLGAYHPVTCSHIHSSDTL